MNRREFLASGLAWLPWFRPRTVRLAGARFRIRRNRNSSRRYLLIHGNEETAREVLREHIATHAGAAFEVEGHARNVALAGGSIDPNRMFSRAGAALNLKRLNPGWSESQATRALDELDRGRERLVRALLAPPGGRTVALHNNSGGYSVTDEVPISDRTSLPEPANPHAFFLCTDPRDFEILAASPYNVVLQQNGPPSDDGSLSRLAAKRKTRYINLEVALGDAARQRQMLGWLEVHVP